MSYTIAQAVLRILQTPPVQMQFYSPFVRPKEENRGSVVPIVPICTDPSPSPDPERLNRGILGEYLIVFEFS